MIQSKQLVILTLILAMFLASCGLAKAGDKSSQDAFDDLAAHLALDDIASGLAMNHSGRYGEAIKRFTRAIKSGRLSPDNLAIAYNNRANAHLDKGDVGKAAQDYNRAILAAPNFTHALYNRGILNYQLKRYRDSLKDFTKVIELDPNYAAAYFNRSFPLLELKKAARAEADLKKAISLDPLNHKYQARLFKIQEIRKDSKN
jgi:tetratricopeptide (TPR) repeat protein